MDTVFSLHSEADRATYLRSLVQAFGCNYICLWLYLPQRNHRSLCFWDGYYHEESNQAGSSSGSLARRLLDEYWREEFLVVNDRVPGMAFINNQPYRELNESQLQAMASIAVQRQFYREARIKTAVFMGCRSGEIEMGWSNETQINLENTMRSLFAEDIPQQSPVRDLSQAVDPNQPSSSSSSLRSLSMESPESSPFLFNIPTTSHISELPQEPFSFQPIPNPITTSTTIQQVVLQSLQLHPIQSTSPTPLQQAMQLSLQPLPSTTSSPLQQAMQSLQPIPNTTSSPLQQAMQSLQPIPNTTNSPLQQALQSLQPIPTTSSSSPLQQAVQSLQPIPSTTSSSLQQVMKHLQSVSSTSSPHQEAMQAFGLTRNVQLPPPESEDAAMTRVILAVLTSSSSTSSSTPNLLPDHYQIRQSASAFKNYSLAPKTQMRPSLRGQSMLKRAITYYKSFITARPEYMKVASRLTSTQLHHMISERRRREKINENFDALRKLLPTEAKKDKVSVLTRTREYLTSLQARVEELSRRNLQLEERLALTANNEAGEEVIWASSSNERVEVRITHVQESTSEEERIVDLQVVMRAESPNINPEMVIRILEFLKQVRDVRLMSVEAAARSENQRFMHRVIMRLRIEGTEWDESAFEEAVRRVVAELAQ